jgi:hypothetical protein
MMQMKEVELKVLPVDEQADVPDRGRRQQKCGRSAAVPGPMSTTPAPTITGVKARMRVLGEGMVRISILFYFLHLFEWAVYILISWFGAQVL